MLYYLRTTLALLLLLCSLGLTSNAMARDELLWKNFTEEEQEWLHTHPLIRVANETDWPPFDFNEAGQAKGYGIEYIELLADKIGLEIEFIYGHPWSELVNLFKLKEIDVMPVIYKNEARQKFTLFTAPYYTGKLGVFSNSKSNVQNYSLAGIRVGMESSHGSIPIVQRMIPGIEITEVDYKIDLVQQLAAGKLDAIIGSPFVFYYLAREHQISNIRLSDFIPLSEQDQKNTSLHIGVREDWPVLHTILQKAMAHVTDEEMARIENKWANIQVVKRMNWRSVFYVLSIVLVVVIFLLWNNKRLHSMVASQTRELQSMNEELEQKVLQRTEKLTETNRELQQSLEEVRQLRGILPICSHCKKIRDDKGYWNQIEAYIQERSDAEFSHSICQDCAQRLYPDIEVYDK